MASKLLHGALVGAVRWPKRSLDTLKLYRSVLGAGAGVDEGLADHLSTLMPPLPSAGPAAWLPVFNVCSAAETAQRSTELGGSSAVVSEGLCMVTDAGSATALVLDATGRSGTPAVSHMTQPLVAHTATLPAEPGAPCWMDVLTDDGAEDGTAGFWSGLLGWEIGGAIPFPAGKYITLMDGLGPENRCKVTGLLPRSAWPAGRSGSPSWVVFFAAETAERVHAVAEQVPEFGGEVLLPPMEADGTVLVCQDAEGATFGLYHRTDPPDEVKKPPPATSGSDS